MLNLILEDVEEMLTIICHTKTVCQHVKVKINKLLIIATTKITIHKKLNNQILIH